MPLGNRTPSRPILEPPSGVPVAAKPIRRFLPVGGVAGFEAAAAGAAVDGTADGVDLGEVEADAEAGLPGGAGSVVCPWDSRGGIALLKPCLALQ